MYFDNLTIAGILMLAPYALLPVLFGRELIRVDEREEETSSGAAPIPSGEPSRGCGGAEPCHGA